VKIVCSADGISRNLMGPSRIFVGPQRAGTHDQKTEYKKLPKKYLGTLETTAAKWVSCDKFRLDGVTKNEQCIRNQNARQVSEVSHKNTLHLQ